MGIIFEIDLKDTFQIPIHPDLQPYLRITLERKVNQFKPLCFGLFTAPQVLTSVFSGVGVGSREKDMAPSLSAGTLRVPSPSLQGLGECHQFGEVKSLEPSNKVQYPGMLIDIIRERVYRTNSRNTRFQNVVEKFLCHSSLSAKMWQKILCTWLPWSGFFPGELKLH